MIKVVVFDWGGVISSAGTPDEVTVSLSQLLEVPLENIQEAFRIQANHFKRGKITEDQFWQALEEQLERPVEPHQRDIWSPIEFFRPNEQIETFIQELQNKYNVAILSNTFPPTAHGIRSQGWYDAFETVILSSDVGWAKPDTEIYDILLKRTKAKPEETLFIDDQEKCLVPARQIGMQTILAQNTSQIIEDVRKAIT